MNDPEQPTPRETVDALLKALQGNDEHAQTRAAQGLADHPDPRVLPALIALGNKANLWEPHSSAPDVGGAAWAAAERVAGRDGAGDAELEVLIKALDGQDPVSVPGAKGVLVALGARVVDRLVAELPVASTYAAASLADALGLIGDPRALPALTVMITSSTEPFVRSAATLAVGRISATRVLGALSAAAGDLDPLVSMNALNVLHALGSRYVAALADATRDPRQGTRSTAQHRLDQIKTQLGLPAAPAAEPAPAEEKKKPVGDYSVVVLCDLGLGLRYPERRDHPFAFRVQRGGFASLLREAAPVTRLAAPIPAGEGFTGQPGESGAQLTFDTLEKLDLRAILQRFPLIARRLLLRELCPHLEAMMRAERRVERAFAEILGDESDRLALRRELGYPEGFGFDAEAVVTSLRDPRIHAVIERFATIEATPGETYRARLRRAMAQCPWLKPGIEAEVQVISEALFFQLLHPGWLRVPADASALTALSSRLDQTLSRSADRLLHDPAVSSMQGLLRSLQRLAEEQGFDIVHCSREALLTRPRELEEAIFVRNPRVVCALHEIDPRVDAAVIAGWASFAATMDAVFLADAPGDLAGPLPDPLPAEWQSLTRPELVGRFALCPQRRRLRFPHGASTNPTAAFNHDEAVLGEGEAELPWGSIAALVATWAAARPVARSPAYGHEALPQGETAFLRASSEFARPFRYLPIFPAPPAEDAARRFALGILDLRCDLAPSLPTIFVPRALVERRPDGRFAAWDPGPGLLPAALMSENALIRVFYRNGIDRCLRCGRETTRKREVSGCRMDGDAYGTMYFQCQCGWSTSLAFDDQCSGETPYYFETRGWK